MKRRLLVTGGAGFIGSNFIRHVLGAHAGYRVVNLDNLTYCGNPENLRDLEKDARYTFVKGDIADGRVVGRLIEGCDCVVNFAAETHVDRSIKDPSRFIKTNVFGTTTLLEAARKAGTGVFLHISTDEVYGSVEKGVSSEEDALRPNSPYSASKAAADMLVRSYFVTYDLPVIVTRSSNNFGPYQYPEKIIPLFITNALEGKKLPVYADGMNVRDWLFVIDNCEAIDLILHKGKAGEIYNIGGGNEIPNLKLTHMLLDIMGKGPDLIEFVKDRPGHDKRYALNISKIRNLGWSPRHDFRTALELTVRWYMDHRGWWERLKRRCKTSK